MSLNREAGVLEVYLGPMSSGKTRQLISSLALHTDLDSRFQTLYINSALDKRGNREGGNDTMTRSNEYASTHNSWITLPDKGRNGVDVIKVSKLSDITDEVIMKYHMICVDEIQFFNDLVESVKHWVDNLKRYVVCAGLDGDDKRQPWNNVSNLLPLADHFEKHTAICKLCSDQDNFSGNVKKPQFTQAPFSHKVDTTTTHQIDVDAHYIPLCRHHFLLLNQGMDEKKEV